MIEHILALQQELIATHIKEADSENLIKELKQRVQVLSCLVFRNDCRRKLFGC